MCLYIFFVSNLASVSEYLNTHMSYLVSIFFFFSWKCHHQALAWSGWVLFFHAVCQDSTQRWYGSRRHRSRTGKTDAWAVKHTQGGLQLSRKKVFTDFNKAQGQDLYKSGMLWIMSCLSWMTSFGAHTIWILHAVFHWINTWRMYVNKETHMPH